MHGPPSPFTENPFGLGGPSYITIPLELCPSLHCNIAVVAPLIATGAMAVLASRAASGRIVVTNAMHAGRCGCRLLGYMAGNGSTAASNSRRRPRSSLPPLRHGRRVDRRASARFYNFLSLRGVNLSGASFSGSSEVCSWAAVQPAPGPVQPVSTAETQPIKRL